MLKRLLQWARRRSGADIRRHIVPEATLALFQCTTVEATGHVQRRQQCQAEPVSRAASISASDISAGSGTGGHRAHGAGSGIHKPSVAGLRASRRKHRRHVAQGFRRGYRGEAVHHFAPCPAAVFGVGLASASPAIATLERMRCRLGMPGSTHRPNASMSRAWQHVRQPGNSRQHSARVEAQGNIALPTVAEPACRREGGHPRIVRCGRGECHRSDDAPFGSTRFAVAWIP